MSINIYNSQSVGNSLPNQHYWITMFIMYTNKED